MSGAPTWAEQAKCRNTDVNVFFPRQEIPSLILAARKVCFGCPVFEQCQTWVLANYEEIPVGIFAGYSTEDRWMFDALLRDVYDWQDTDWQFDITGARAKASIERYESRRRAKAHHATEIRKQAKLAARPDCPQGHSRENVYKYRKTKSGEQVWSCYLCYSKMTMERDNAHQEAS